ncbi:MAG TPA: hypothetical protein VI728_13405 [Syntrophales bacterium]|nr:hypothetical protein [Syntrophales bacterium]
MAKLAFRGYRVCDKNVGIIFLQRLITAVEKGGRGIRNKSKRIFILSQIFPNPSLLKRGEKLLYT